MTSWTLHHPMFHDLRGHCSFPSTIILGFALLAWLVLLSGRLFHLGFDERWRRRFLFFHLFDPSQSDTKPFLRLFQCLTQFLVLFSQLGRFFFCHDPSLSERSSLNSYCLTSRDSQVNEKIHFDADPLLKAVCVSS